MQRMDSGGCLKLSTYKGYGRQLAYPHSCLYCTSFARCKRAGHLFATKRCEIALHACFIKNRIYHLTPMDGVIVYLWSFMMLRGTQRQVHFSSFYGCVGRPAFHKPATFFLYYTINIQ